MLLWWIGNAVLALVVLAVLVVLLQRLTRPVADIKQHAADALHEGVGLLVELDALEELAETRDRARQANAGVQRYSQALEQLL